MLEYRSTFEFSTARERVWDALTAVESFPDWATWMRDLTVRGDGVAPGSVFTFEVDSPLPLDLKLEIEITEAMHQETIEAEVRQDLRGTGRLELRDAFSGTEVEVSWKVEPVSTSLRALLFVSGPVVRWSQNWAVRSAVAAARRRFGEAP